MTTLPHVQEAARNLRDDIELSSARLADAATVGAATRALAHALNGRADVSKMTPAVAALYILSLALSKDDKP